MRGLTQSKVVPVAQAAVHLNSSNKILQAEIALVRGAFQRQRTAGSQGVSEFPRLIRKILHGQGVLREVPPPALRPKKREVLDLEISGFLQVVVIRHPVRIFLSCKDAGTSQRQQGPKEQSV